MQRVKVNLGERSYPILIGSREFEKFARVLKGMKLGEQAVVITTPQVQALYGSLLKRALTAAGSKSVFIAVEDSEKSKSFGAARKLIQELTILQKKGRIFLVALGGGVVGDLTGFVASVYRRGINYIQVPTTLLAQVDSSIGGKVGIDLPEGKNLVGAFYQPRLVYMDITALKTLPGKELKSGLAEIIKYGIILFPAAIRYIEANRSRILKKDLDSLLVLVSLCSRLKANLVEKDERDNKGRRIILNYGHTIGHAIEAAAGYGRYSHGEAVALGMVCAGRVSMKLGLADKGIVRRIEDLLVNIGLPAKVKGCSIDKIMAAMSQDKKFKGSGNRFVLLRDLGHIVVKENIPEKLIKEVIKEITGQGTVPDLRTSRAKS